MPSARGAHPTRLIVAGFIGFILFGAGFLALPLSHTGEHPGFMRCLFTSTSAVTVTGLANVPASDWSPFGEVVLVVLMQVGGFGIMTVGAVFALLMSQRLGLRQRMVAQHEIGALTPGEVRSLVKTIGVATFVIELLIALVLAARLWHSGVESLPGAVWSGVFHSVAAFNNAGLSLYDDNLMGFVGDPVICLAITFGIIIGGIGFPVLFEIVRERRRARWSLHTKITLSATALLLVVGPLVVTVFEWSNARTLGSLTVPEKLLAGWFQGVTPRTAGFNTVDIGGLRASTLLVIVVLMFIGAGAASTAGGIKVTTFAVVGWAVWSEVRGEGEPTVFRRRIDEVAIRQALAVIVLSIGTVVTAALVVITLVPVEAFDAIFETVSAFGTVGLSTGVTTLLDGPAQLVLIAVMLAGRVGPTTFAAAFVTRERPRLFQLPKERPIIG